MMRNVVLFAVLILLSCGREESREPCQMNLFYQRREPYNTHLDLVKFGVRDIPEACVLVGVPMRELRMNLKVVSYPSPGWLYSLRISDREFDLSQFNLSEGNVDLEDIRFDDDSLIDLVQPFDIAIYIICSERGCIVPRHTEISYVVH